MSSTVLPDKRPVYQHNPELLLLDARALLYYGAEIFPWWHQKTLEEKRRFLSVHRPPIEEEPATTR